MSTIQKSKVCTEASEAALKEAALKEAALKEAARRASRKPLTNFYIRNAEVPGRYYDFKGHGLCLVVSPEGNKRWTQRVTLLCGTRREPGLGRYPDVSLKAARLQALENHLKVARGEDPVELKRTQRRHVPTFAEAVEEVLELRRPDWSDPKVEQRWRRCLERHAYPALRHRSVSEIHTRDVVRVLVKLRQRFPKLVPRVRQQISAVLSWAVGMGYRTDDPCGAALDALMPGKPPPSDYHPALPYAQVPAALARARASERWIGERLLLEFLVLTAVRTNEARGALWSEIDWDARRWTVPAERMKERKEHVVPLSTAALAVLREARDHPDLEEVRHCPDNSDLVFPSMHGRLLYNNALSKMLSDMEVSAVPHGFRSSFANWSAESGFEFDLTEICLSHAVGTHVARRYRRTGLVVPRVPIMEGWGEHVASARSVACGGDSGPSPVAGSPAGPGAAPGVALVSPNTRGRDFVVGDVHGCFRTLGRALQALSFAPGRDRLFGVGDLVNRGPHSREALEWLEQRFDAVALGNHDRALLRWLEGPLGLSLAGSEWSDDIPASERARWRAALGAMPLAITIPTAHGDVGVVHADVPHPTWSEAAAVFEAGDPWAVDVALLGLAASAPAIREHQSRGVAGLRALVHGHHAGRTVRRTANRWNIDTGAGSARLNRLTLLHVNARTIRAARFPVDESP